MQKRRSLATLADRISHVPLLKWSLTGALTTLHILFNLLGAGVLALTFPLVFELFVLSLAARLPGRAKARAEWPVLRPPKLWAIIPAHNEEFLIAACVRSLLASSEPSCGVLVVAHNCTDDTFTRATQAGAEAATLRDTGAGGKGAALQFGFSEAFARGAEAVLIVDADSTVSPNLIAALQARLEAGAAAVQCRYLVAEPNASPRTRLMALAFLGMNLLRPRGRSRLGFSCGLFGNGFALQRSTLERVPYLAHSVVEDLEYHLLLLRAGVRVEFVDEAVVLGEMPHASAAAATQRARWEGGRQLMRRQWTLPLFRDVLRGRVRMLEPLLDLLSLPMASGVVLLVLASLLPVFWIRTYAAVGLLTMLLYVLVSASLAASPVTALRALVSAPGYLLWKLAMLPRTRLAARRNAAWVRTGRNLPPDSNADSR